MYFNYGTISSLNDKPLQTSLYTLVAISHQLKLEDCFMYLGSNISSTESNVIEA